MLTQQICCGIIIVNKYVYTTTPGIRSKEKGKMKRYEFIGHLDYYKRLNSSCYGNPAYYGEFINSDGETLKGRTASDAACAYGFLNEIEKPRKITYHVTRTGNVIFDYVDILKEA